MIGTAQETLKRRRFNRRYAERCLAFMVSFRAIPLLGCSVGWLEFVWLWHRDSPLVQNGKSSTAAIQFRFLRRGSRSGPAFFFGPAPVPIRHHRLSGDSGAVTRVNWLCDRLEGLPRTTRAQHRRQPGCRGYTEFGMECEWDPRRRALPQARCELSQRTNMKGLARLRCATRIEKSAAGAEVISPLRRRWVTGQLLWIAYPRFRGGLVTVASAKLCLTL